MAALSVFGADLRCDGVTEDRFNDQRLGQKQAERFFLGRAKHT